MLMYTMQKLWIGYGVGVSLLKQRTSAVITASKYGETNVAQSHINIFSIQLAWTGE